MMTRCENVCEAYGTGIFQILEGKHRGRFIGILGDSVGECKETTIFVAEGMPTALADVCREAYGNGVLPYTTDVPDPDYN